METTQKISELYELLKSGAISQEEYENLKQNVLSENSKSNEQNIPKEEEVTENPTQNKSNKKILMLSTIGIVIIVLLILVFKTHLFTDSSSSERLQIGTLKDYEGNVYETVKIGKQYWMKENLKSIYLNDGTPIQVVPDNKIWDELSTPALCWYNNDEYNNKKIYGALYNWYAVNTKKLCPQGWHVPNKKEWEKLISNLGGEKVAGGKLKESGTIHWDKPNTGATNDIGFNALPGGMRFSNGLFGNLGYLCEWWFFSEPFSAKENILTLGTTIIYIGYNGGNEKDGISVRCLKN